jgi:MATE family multidrug resistance protein
MEYRMNINSSTQSYGYILKLAMPLVLTMSSQMLMQFVDALFLSWYSVDAVAAVIPAGMAYWFIACGFNGTAGYASTFVAHYIGARKLSNVAPIVWQGIYFALLSGAIVAAASFTATPLFRAIGHTPAIQIMEAQFFRITCLGAPLGLLAAALTGFFAGREDTKTIFYVQALGALTNILLDYVLIFGNWGFPRLGVVGAAIATVSAQGAIFLTFAIVFLKRQYRREFLTWRGRGIDSRLFIRLIRFGAPTGFRFAIEMLAWTAFLLFIGRIGVIELTSTNIAWRINGLAFFPIIGLAQAVGILVGNAQGKSRPDISSRLTYRGLILAEVWMAAVGVVLVVFPRELYGLFYKEGAMSLSEFSQVSGFGVVLLRMVAVYSLLDSFNIIFLASLQSAGDTRWTLIAAIVAHIVFIAALVWADIVKAGLMVEWVLATVFVILQGLLWLARFRSGKWREIKVIETF